MYIIIRFENKLNTARLKDFKKLVIYVYYSKQLNITLSDKLIINILNNNSIVFFARVV